MDKFTLCNVDSFFTPIIGHFNISKKIEICYFTLVLIETPVWDQPKIRHKLKFLRNDESKAYSAFLEYVLKQLNNINIFPTFRNTCSRTSFIIPSICEKNGEKFPQTMVSRAINEANIKYLPTHNFPLEKISFRDDCNKIIKKRSQNPVEKRQVITRICEKCLKFYIESVQQNKKRCYNFSTKDSYKKMTVFTAEKATFGKSRYSKGIAGFPGEIGLKTKSNFASTIWKGLGKRLFCQIFRSLSAILNG